LNQCGGDHPVFIIGPSHSFSLPVLFEMSSHPFDIPIDGVLRDLRTAYPARSFYRYCRNTAPSDLAGSLEDESPEEYGGSLEEETMEEYQEKDPPQANSIYSQADIK